MKVRLFNSKNLALALCLGTMFCAWGNSATIWAKAHLAQYLIADAWQQTLATQKSIAPWPWADTWPVARLKNKHLEKDLFVLAGTNGTSLAFGPGHMDGTTSPNQPGTSVIAGHKDTHFTFLENVAVGERFYLQGKDGNWKSYEATSTEIVDSDSSDLLLDNSHNELLLITCYPFNSSVTRGPLRYVVRARPLDYNHIKKSHIRNSQAALHF